MAPHPDEPKALDQVRRACRARQYSRRTEEAYTGWIRRYVIFHDKRHPREMGAGEVAAFLKSSKTNSLPNSQPNRGVKLSNRRHRSSCPFSIDVRSASRALNVRRFALLAAYRLSVRHPELHQPAVPTLNAAHG
jgi:hypothetical protein